MILYQSREGEEGRLNCTSLTVLIYGDLSRDVQVRRNGREHTFLCVCARVCLLFWGGAGLRALQALNQLLLIEDLKNKGLSVWVFEAILDLRGHTHPVPGPLETLRIGPGGDNRF